MLRPILIINLALVVILSGCASQATQTSLSIATPQPATITPAPPPTQPGSTPVQPMVKERTPDWTLAVAGRAIWAPITVDKGIIYAGSDDTYLYAVDIATKNVKWKFKTDGIVRSKPTVGKDLVYITSDDGYVYAVSISDGSQAWKCQIYKVPLVRDPAPWDNGSFDFFTSAPTLQDDILYAASIDGTLSALDAANGTIIWTFNTNKGIPIYITPQVDGDLVIFGERFGDFYGVDAKKGTKTWIFQSGDSIFANGFTLVDHVAYFGTSIQIYALDTQTGSVKWKTDNEYLIETPAYRDGELYLEYSPPGKFAPLAVYNATDGKFLRNLFSGSGSCGIYCVVASPVLGKSNVYFGLYADAFYAIDIKSGETQWKVVSTFPSKQGVTSTAAVVDGMVYFAGMDGMLYAVQDD